MKLKYKLYYKLNMSIDTEYTKGKINLGLCCLNTELRKKNIFNSRNTIRRTFSVERAKELAMKNIKDLIPMIEYNYKHNINCFRLSSDMFPHFTDSETEKYNIDFCKEELKLAGDLAKKYNQRIVMHPGQYNQVGAKSQKIYDKTVEDLVHHANILDTAGIDENGVLIVHGGGIYGDKENTKRRWIEQFDELPTNVKKRLVIENCEKCYFVRDVLDIAQECKIPVVYDCHHYLCYKYLHPEENLEKSTDMLCEVVQSWGNKRMLCHVSSQGDGPIGHHADYIDSIPKHMLKIPQNYGIEVDIEVEAKMKEKAIFKLKEQYKDLF